MSDQDTKKASPAWRTNAIALVSGLLFSVGLGVAGMTNPNKVLNFLDVFGEWDPSLAFVMLGAIAVYHVVFRVIGGDKAPKFGERFHWPTKTDIDRRLVLGSILFGVGWGTGGFCPGPAIVATTSFESPVLVFFAAMTIGMLAQRWMADTAAFKKVMGK